MKASKEIRHTSGRKGQSDSVKHSRETLLVVVLSVWLAITFAAVVASVFVVKSLNLSEINRNLHSLSIPATQRAVSEAHVAKSQRLILYNKPPKTGSTTIRVAMTELMEKNNMNAAHCFRRTEWNDMSIRSIVNLHKIDFWGCHLRLTKDKVNNLMMMRGGNVVFMTSTRRPENIILSSYLQYNRNREREILSRTSEGDIQKEVALYKSFVDQYPIDALYVFHGAEEPLKECPVKWPHVLSMREVAERYEIVVDVTRPEESAAMVQRVTGLRPNFGEWLNQRTTNHSNPVIKAFLNVDTSHRECGNDLVHKTLMQRFNIIKDRVMENECFDEMTGRFERCDSVKMTTEHLKRQL